MYQNDFRASCPVFQGHLDHLAHTKVYQSRVPADHYTQAGRRLQDEPMCSNGIVGIQSKNSCCALECGQCGSDGCSTVNGLGAEMCCETVIAESGELCEDSGSAPCIIDAGTCTYYIYIHMVFLPLVFVDVLARSSRLAGCRVRSLFFVFSSMKIR